MRLFMELVTETRLNCFHTFHMSQVLKAELLLPKKVPMHVEVSLMLFATFMNFSRAPREHWADFGISLKIQVPCWCLRFKRSDLQVLIPWNTSARPSDRSVTERDARPHELKNLCKKRLRGIPASRPTSCEFDFWPLRWLLLLRIGRVLLRMPWLVLRWEPWCFWLTRDFWGLFEMLAFKTSHFRAFSRIIFFTANNRPATTSWVLNDFQSLEGMTECGRESLTSNTARSLGFCLGRLLPVSRVLTVDWSDDLPLARFTAIIETQSSSFTEVATSEISSFRKWWT
jgi:hypothetical protein